MKSSAFPALPTTPSGGDVLSQVAAQAAARLAARPLGAAAVTPPALPPEEDNAWVLPSRLSAGAPFSLPFVVDNAPSSLVEAEASPEPILIDTGPSPNGWHGHETELMCDQYAALAAAGVRGERDPLVRGTLLHIGLAHLYARKWCRENGVDPDTYYDAPAAVNAKIDRESDPLFRKWGPAVRRALAAYSAYWAQMDAAYRVVSVERVYTWPAGTLIVDTDIAVETTEDERRALALRGVPPEYARYRVHRIPARDYTMRIDLVMEHIASGSVYVLDHKGTATLTADVPLRYALSGQFLGLQATGFAMWGSRYRGAYPNLVSFEDPPRFGRPPLLPAPHALSSWRSSVQAAHVRRETRKLEGKPLLEHTKLLNERTCKGPYGLCEHFHVCRTGFVETPREISR